MEKIHSVCELKVSYMPKYKEVLKVTSSRIAFEYLVQLYPLETIQLKEQFVVLYLNNRKRIIGAYKLSEGGQQATVVDIKIVLGVALKIAASGIILSHNHPSGETQPSKPDIDCSLRIKDACNLLDLKLVDHIILGSPVTYLSMRDEGLI